MGAEDYIDACYAEWLMKQPEAQITSGDVLVQRMEAQWGFDRFIKEFTFSPPAATEDERRSDEWHAEHDPRH